MRVGPRRLLAELIHVEGEVGTLQVYEDTGGLRVGDPVYLSGAPLVAWLGPGMLGRVFDGLQRPLDPFAAAGLWLLRPGAMAEEAASELVASGPDAATAGATERTEGASSLGSARWAFHATARPGQVVGPGDVIGEVAEGGLRHSITLPPLVPSGRLAALKSGTYSVQEPIGSLEAPSGSVPLRLAHPWPLRSARPVQRRRSLDRPLVTGQRVIDMLYPVARGGTAVIPGGFGTGKTVVEQQLARWSDADIVVYVGCGERGNEMADVLATFPELQDPRSGAPLLDRTVLIANTSNMPVAAREASVQLGITIAEYFRDQGLHVALLADSTSRWAEALREIERAPRGAPRRGGLPGVPRQSAGDLLRTRRRDRCAGRPIADRFGHARRRRLPSGGDFSEP